MPDAYLPAESSHDLESHEAACLLNVSDEDASVAFTLHGRLDRADQLGVELPRGTPFAYAVESDVPVVLQHSRLDTTAGGYTLFTTIAYSDE